MFAWIPAPKEIFQTLGLWKSTPRVSSPGSRSPVAALVASPLLKCTRAGRSQVTKWLVECPQKMICAAGADLQLGCAVIQQSGWQCSFFSGELLVVPKLASRGEVDRLTVPFSQGSALATKRCSSSQSPLGGGGPVVRRPGVRLAEPVCCLTVLMADRELLARVPLLVLHGQSHSGSARRCLGLPSRAVAWRRSRACRRSHM